MNVEYDPEAIEQLNALISGNERLAERLNTTLDAFEDDPSDARYRTRAYTGAAKGAFGFVVRGPDDDVLVLWQQFNNGIRVWYIGPPI